jgi:hypothetical protein
MHVSAPPALGGRVCELVYLGNHFLFTARLFPLLAQSAPSRIVNLSSQGHLIAQSRQLALVRKAG